MVKCKMKNVKSPILSVIIPMYNCAPVIERCLKSIDCSDCEILVVNDGSTDNSADVVNNYALSHPNVRLINKPNGGVSSARNLGIEEAQGKYIAFVDADDYVMHGGFQYVVALAEEHDADVVKFDLKSVSDDAIPDHYDTADTNNVTIRKATGKEVLQRYDMADTVVWDGIYRRDIIMDNAIRFHTDLKLHEDDVFNGMVHCHAKTVLAANVVMYCYVRASSCSWTHQRSPERLKLLIESGYKAARYRSEYVRAHYSDAMPMERLKQMRYVCMPSKAYAANMSLAEYMDVLNQFRALGLYPLDYKWIKVAYWYAPMKRRMKYAVKTFLCNHPRLAWAILKMKI